DPPGGSRARYAGPPRPPATLPRATGRRAGQGPPRGRRPPPLRGGGADHRLLLGRRGRFRPPRRPGRRRGRGAFAMIARRCSARRSLALACGVMLAIGPVGSPLLAQEAVGDDPLTLSD